MAQHTFTFRTIKVTIDLAAFDEAVLADQVVSADDWLRGFANMVQAKIDAVKGRIASAQLETALELGTIHQLPAAKDELVAAVFAQPGYKNRRERDEEEKLSREKRL